MAKNFDAQCYELAVYFLRDVKGATDMDRTELAEQIQQTVEDFISGLLETEE